ncbi:hypothetical protein NDU88_002108 [Pleurodeles waltl]|uniref:Uncharacterized protein n=1 Tax=Pleurodeles waltl TaxID=8319 RepID=A0AAV7WKG6_PLEWA|nr:hypothetical protein NDU88_002108 [Pleurodeles waltl]
MLSLLGKTPLAIPKTKNNTTLSAVLYSVLPPPTSSEVSYSLVLFRTVPGRATLSPERGRYAGLVASCSSTWTLEQRIGCRHRDLPSGLGVFSFGADSNGTSFVAAVSAAFLYWAAFRGAVLVGAAAARCRLFNPSR